MPKRSQRKPVKNLGGNAPKGPGNEKGVKQKLILVVVAAYVVISIVAAYFYFGNKEVKKEIQVQTVLQISNQGKPCGDFNPGEITAVGPDKMAVTDINGHRLLLFSLNGNFIKSVGDTQSKNPRDRVKFEDVSSDDQQNLYVVDNATNNIDVYSSKGVLAQTFSLQPMNCYVPRSVCWNGSYFLLADTGGQKIVKISPSGEILAKWGSLGDCKDCFNNAYRIVPDPTGNGNFYVPDLDNKRVKYMDPSGKVLKIIKLESRPNSAAVDSRGNLYVASAEGNFVKVYAPAAGPYQGDLKDTKGLELFNSIQGMAFAADGTLLITDKDGITEIKVPSPAATQGK